MINEKVTKLIIETLNTMLELDPETVKELINHRVKCNSNLTTSAAFQVGRFEDGDKIGMLGVINAFTGVDKQGCGGVAVVTDVNGNITKFQRYKQQPAK